ncbi:MAG: hypothetical protein JRI72_11095 [Deltaproteobacteria bacterium]|nr:hypothetical protein [Deltaproteobacteria bacterium]
MTDKNSFELDGRINISDRVIKVNIRCVNYAQAGIHWLSFIDEQDVIKRILKHLCLWKIKVKPPPKSTGPPKAEECHIDAAISQLPVSDNWLAEGYLFSVIDPQYPDEFLA